MRVHVLQCVKLLAIVSLTIQILKNERGGERRKMCVVNGSLGIIKTSYMLAS